MQEGQDETAGEAARAIWMTAKPAPVELAHLEEKVFSLFCNDSHVFCVVQAGKVAVYDLTSGQCNG